MKLLRTSIAILALAGMCQAANAANETFANDEAFLDWIQRTHFNYMWDGAEPNSGLAYECIQDGDLQNTFPFHDKNVITTGGSGFGVAGILVGIERGFIGREQGVERLEKIASFLEKADRFHGMWPHQIKPDGKVQYFPYSGVKDDGGDIVESAYMAASLIMVREYFKNGNEREKALAAKVDDLWRGMEFDWYQNGQDVVYWHWSPNYNWEMNFPITGYNECLIVYVLGASSPTHPIRPESYHKGWARNGEICSDLEAYGIPLHVKYIGAEECGGPLFWSHFSWIGLDPRGLKDKYADYWEVNRNHARTDYAYCVDNPIGFKGYGEDCWGLTASYSLVGYEAHAPNVDYGVITPTASLCSMAYTPEESLRAAKHFYDKGERHRGTYGFYDAFSDEKDWVMTAYLAIDQCPIAPMIENYRTGMLWNLFMGAPEVQEGLKKLGFESPHFANKDK